MKNRIVWPSIIIISALLTGIASSGVLGQFFQFVLISWFILVIPGMAYIRLAHSLRPLPLWIYAITFSIVLATLVSLVMVLTHNWYPFIGLFVLIAISIIGAVLQLVFAFRQDL